MFNYVWLTKIFKQEYFNKNNIVSIPYKKIEDM